MTVSRRYLVAMDKFKGTLTADEASAAVARGIRRSDREAEIVRLPFADGGEGTVRAVVAAGAVLHRDTVPGPLGDPTVAEWALLGDTAVIEMAQAAGLDRVVPSPSTSLDSHTAGVGHLIRLALEHDVERIVIGVGGSVTTDGGFGALRALGARFIGAGGAEIDDVRDLADAREVDVDSVDQRLVGVDIVICADVLAPLTGPRGAAAVFGPQKGADADALVILEHRLLALAHVYAGIAGSAPTAVGGAAGGLAAGIMAVLGGRVRSGVEVLAELLGLDDLIGRADVVVIGEGALDEQSRFGKAPVGIARRARDLGVPAIAVVGASTFSSDFLRKDGIEIIGSAVASAGSVEIALGDPSTWVECAAAEAVARFSTARQSA